MNIYRTFPNGSFICSLALLCGAVMLVGGSSQSRGEDEAQKTDGAGIKLVLLPAGEFIMGTKNERAMRGDHPHSGEQQTEDERPEFRCKLTKPFYLGVHEVTVGQFRKFVQATGYQTDGEKTGGACVFDPQAKDEVQRFPKLKTASWKEPGFPQTEQHPVTCVSWKDANAFCQWLTKTEGANYRLPTEAEWEYACRAGTDTWYFCGNLPADVYRHANVADAALHEQHAEIVVRQSVELLAGNARDGQAFTAPAGSFRPNKFGLYDTHGNVWEWCDDRYEEQRYRLLRKSVGAEHGWQKQHEPVVDPLGPLPTDRHQHGDWRVMRGGSNNQAPVSARSAVRAYAEAADAFPYIGFRVVRDVKP